MNNSSMNDDSHGTLTDLVDDYRDIEAPPHLATRIRAETANRPVRNHGWVPAASTAVLAAALIGILPMLWQGNPPPRQTPLNPSLATLASMKIEKPSVAQPSLSQVRSVRAPKMPAKPTVTPAREQTNSTFDDFEEKNHADA